MKVKELVEKLSALNPELNVWLGVNGGEGWVSISEVFEENSKWCDLDGDEIDDEHSFFEAGASIPDKYTFREKLAGGEVGAYADIVVLGEYRAQDSVEENKKIYQIRQDQMQKIVLIAEARKKMESDPEYQKLKQAERNLEERYKSGM